MSWSRPTLLRIDADSYAELPWAGVLLDEAQFVKTIGPRPTRVPVGCDRTSSSRSPARRWKTTDGTLGAAIHRRTRIVPPPRQVLVLPAAHRTRPGPTTDGPTPTADLAAHAASDQGTRGIRAAAKQEQAVEVVLQPKHMRITRRTCSVNDRRCWVSLMILTGTDSPSFVH